MRILEYPDALVDDMKGVVDAVEGPVEVFEEQIEGADEGEKVIKTGKAAVGTVLQALRAKQGDDVDAGACYALLLDIAYEAICRDVAHHRETAGAGGDEEMQRRKRVASFVKKEAKKHGLSSGALRFVANVLGFLFVHSVRQRGRAAEVLHSLGVCGLMYHTNTAFHGAFKSVYERVEGALRLVLQATGATAAGGVWCAASTAPEAAELSYTEQDLAQQAEQEDVAKGAALARGARIPPVALDWRLEYDVITRDTVALHIDDRPDPYFTVHLLTRPVQAGRERSTHVMRATVPVLKHVTSVLQEALNTASGGHASRIGRGFRPEYFRDG